MTTEGMTTMTGADAPVSIRHSADPMPRGIPKWLGLLGVTVQPLGAVDAEGRRAWVVSAGAGTTGVAALFQTAEQDPHHNIREDRT